MNTNSQPNANLVISHLFGVLGDIERTNATWFRQFDDLNIDTASQSEIEEILISAPTESSRFYIFGILSMRVALANVTGRV